MSRQVKAKATRALFAKPSHGSHTTKQILTTNCESLPSIVKAKLLHYLKKVDNTALKKETTVTKKNKAMIKTQKNMASSTKDYLTYFIGLHFTEMC